MGKFIAEVDTARSKRGRCDLSDVTDDGRGTVQLLVRIQGGPSDEPTAAWVIKAAARRERYHLPQLPVAIDRVRLTKDHPLLLTCGSPRHELYVAERPSNPQEAAQMVFSAHEHAAQGFIEPRTYLRGMREAQVAEFLSKGVGMIADGPLQLLRAYHEVLEKLGCRPSLVRVIDGSTDASGPPASLKALVLEPSAVVVSDDFQTRRMTDLAKIDRLVERWRGW